MGIPSPRSTQGRAFQNIGLLEGRHFIMVVLSREALHNIGPLEGGHSIILVHSREGVPYLGPL